MPGEEIELEKKLAILAACVTLLNLKRRTRIEAEARRALFSGWSIAARLDPPSEVWCTAKWGWHEEEV